MQAVRCLAMTLLPLVLVLLSLPFSASFSVAMSPSRLLPRLGSSSRVVNGRAVGLRMQEDQQQGLTRRNVGFLAAGVAAVVGSRKLVAGGVWEDGATNLKGKTAVVTGGNTGIGKETAVRLAGMGANVIIGCRSMKRGETAVAEIKERAAAGGGSVQCMELDLSDLSSVRRFGEEFRRGHSELYALVNNAGIMALPKRQESKDGFERQFAVNHLGHFELTKQLWPLLEKSEDARLVSVSSDAHFIAAGDADPLSDWNSEKDYQPWGAYGRSKLFNILFAKEIARREGDKAKVSACAIHPGVVKTELGRSYFVPPEACNSIGSVECTGSLSPPEQLGLLALAPVMLYSAKTPAQGAMTQVKCAAAQGIGPSINGKYLRDCAVGDTAPIANDAELAGRLWALSEKLTGSPFKVGSA
uniref:Uncharacterized protein n=2 Tax=Hemiselmis andersenii TaxID=464988 RepID=A0A7S0XT82_HEMAN|mmetsp:Transcript_19061/g.43841  ORF Transcript_19061/g.43841 Transcript_19061/m.43841 type:complete len:414 (+) Transcript_19061:82-1323(+)